jgi:hypothetical protein
MRVRWLRYGLPVLLGVGLLTAVIASRTPGSSEASVPLRTMSSPDAMHVVGHTVAQHDVRPLRVRLTLEELLGHHSILAVRMMRAMVGDSPDLRQTLQDSLSSNTAALVDAVKTAHGQKAGETFRRLWTDHIIALIRYAEAVATNDGSAERSSERQLDRYRQRFGSFVQSATNNRLKAEDVAAGLKTHISHLTRQAEAYAAGNYATAYRLERAAFAHMFPTGKALASGLVQVPGEFPVHVHDPGQELRSTLGLLLGEHVELVVDATRAGVAGSPREFKQAASALNGNTKDLSEAIDALFGRKSARQFVDIWSDHIDLFVDYTEAVAAGTQTDTDETTRRLQEFQRRLGAFLVKATGGKREIAAVTDELSMHDDLLLRQIDAYADENYAVAHSTSNRAYGDMFALASKLGALIEQKTEKTAPKGGAQTGGGGSR